MRVTRIVPLAVVVAVFVRGDPEPPVTLLAINGSEASAQSATDADTVTINAAGEVREAEAA